VTFEHVRAMRTVIGGLEALPPPEAPADTTALLRQRVLLARVTADFLNGERARLAGTMEGERLMARLVDLRLRYSAHISDWGGRRIVAEWSRYRANCLDLIVAVRRLMPAEATPPLAA